ncbi:hypothetical protein EC957_010853 [Mortierella hygrophila]|uniref:HTH CENPB-type domain-containing protein n=1 Tax=Mortierella hygrophila TaxID=979708 RepID=A0A9P6FA69_9FUNG|nr:hypothetical protein EC957_010853 [Mortierella hygrophila]
MTKKVVLSRIRIELFDIYHYLVGRFEDTNNTVSFSTFNQYVGIDLAKAIIEGPPCRSPTAYYYTQNKNTVVDTFVVQWLEDQKKRNTPVSAKMIQNAAMPTYVVLQGWFESEKGGFGVHPSFCAPWFDGFKKRHNVSQARYVQGESLDMMNIRITSKGWMNRHVFMEWLKSFDDDLTERFLLLLDSCPAHNNIDMRDPETNTPWKHLHILRLPKNSTSVTQPLDAGILSQETCIVRDYDNAKPISNGQAWSLLPYAWNKVKASTIRNCFAHAPVLPEAILEDLRRRPSFMEEQLELAEYSLRNNYTEQEETYFQHLIAKVGDNNNWSLKAIGEQNAQARADLALA